MTRLANSPATRPMLLRLSTAAELMTSNPLSIERETPIQKASALLEFYNLEAVPVVDAHGRPLGVVTMEACHAWQEFWVRSARRIPAADLDTATVEEIMRPLAPAQDIVHQDDPSSEVIEKLLEHRPRRAYVVNDEGELVGVVSAADVLRHLLRRDIHPQDCAPSSR